DQRRRRRARLEGDRNVLRASQGRSPAQGGSIVTRAAVVGCGIMGSGITFVARAAGFPVTAVEPTDALVAAARERVERHEAQARKRGAEPEGIAPLEMTTDVAAPVAAADGVREAVPVARGIEFARAVGKETVEVRDMPGFVTTRLGTLLMCEAMRAYEQGVASAEHVDTAMKLGYNHPMGPLELADRVGLDTVLFVLD